MIGALANLNAGLAIGDESWRSLRTHDVTVTYREGGLFIEHGRLASEHEHNYALAHDGIHYRYSVVGKYRTTEISPGDGRLVRLAHRRDQCELCCFLLATCKEG